MLKSMINPVLSGKTRIHIYSALIFAGLVYCFSSCSGGIPAGDEQTNKDLFVEFRTYSVSYPVGDDWKCEIDRFNESVSFTRDKIELTTVSGATLIIVQKYRMKSDTFSLNEKQIADDYRKNDLNIIKEEVNKEQYELEDVVLFDTVINEKKFYCMSYDTSREGGNRYGFTAESILAFYFPTDLKERKFFFRFFISDLKKPITFVGNDTGQLYPILKSFILKKQ